MTATPVEDAAPALDSELFDRLAAAKGATDENARARLVGINRVTLYRYRTGRYAPRLDVAARIAAALDTTPAELFPALARRAA